MSELDGCYVKTPRNPAFWLVEDGKRTPVHNVYQYGLRRVVVISEAALDAIPLAGLEEDEEE